MLLAALQSLPVPSEIPKSARSAQGARTGLLFRAGKWDAAHNLAQDLDTPEGSFWHGILHRGEKDWSNAGYWFRKVGRHPVYPALRSEAAVILARHPDSAWQLGSSWDPHQFIGWCERAVADPDSGDAEVVTAIEVAEWSLLFHWCLE